MNLPKLSFLTSTLRLICRQYAIKSDLKIKWFRPEKIPCIEPKKSGDLEAFPTVDKSKPLVKFEGIRELEKVPEIVKKQFTLEMAPKSELRKRYSNEMMASVQPHPFDNESIERKIARMTANIRYFQAHLKTLKRNTKMRVRLKEQIDKRRKNLRLLRLQDYPKFEWLLEKLNITYKGYPEHYHWVARKDSMRKLTAQHCENVKQERLRTLREKFEAQQLPFLEQKIKNLEFIRNEQIACKVPVTVSEAQIDVVKKQYKELKARREAEKAKEEKKD